MRKVVWIAAAMMGLSAIAQADAFYCARAILKYDQPGVYPNAASNAAQYVIRACSNHVYATDRKGALLFPHAAAMVSKQSAECEQLGTKAQASCEVEVYRSLILEDLITH